MKLNRKNIFPHLDEDTMPIGAWVSPPVSYINQASYQDIKLSGINTIYGLYENAEDHLSKVIEALDYAEENEIGYLVRDKRLQSVKTIDEVLSYTKAYREKKACAGVLISDEPGVIEYAQLKKAKDLFNKVMPNQVFYVNLLPLYAEAWQLVNGVAGGEEIIEDINIERYYDNYIQTLNPDYISYDYYPLIGEFPKVEDTYFKQLSIIKNKAIKNNIPYWVFIQTCSFNAHVRVPIKEEIFWQVSTALAYGAKGVQYFTYFIPYDGRKEQFKGSMIDHNGNKTSIYDDVKAVNQHIKSVDHLLMHAKHQGLLSVGTTPAEIPDEDLIEKIDAVKRINGNHVLIGLFEYQGKEIMYLVNNSIDEDDDINLDLNRVYDIVIIQQNKEMKIKTKLLSLHLFPGEGVLIQII